MSRVKRLRVAILAALLLSALLIAWSQWPSTAAKPLPVLPLGDVFELQRGEAQWSSQSATGQVMLVNFGYTHCPDICPMTLAKFRAVETALGEQAKSLVPVFISIDPVRDTPAHLQQYAAYFSPHIVALTGTESELAAVAKQFAAYYSVAGDEVSHSDYIYLLDQQGRARVLYDQQASVDAMVAGVQQLLQEAL